MSTSEVKDKMAEIAKKQAQAVTLRQQLERSLAIQELWPGVFSADAQVAGAWRSDAVTGVTFSITRVVPLPSNMKAETRVFPLDRVPEALHATMPTQLVVRLHEQQRKQALMRRIQEGVRRP